MKNLKYWCTPRIVNLSNSTINSGNGMNPGAEYIVYCDGATLTTFTFSGNGNGPSFMGIDVGQTSTFTTPAAVGGVCS